ncbi:lipopolysaccharide biosynthesis protein [Candidatus Sumerlaeota bacterium]|nr:lipopolysaccharide biosynthesis protein [Candidatus Sumerlaeota bacterium]
MSELKTKFARGMVWNSLSIGSAIVAQVLGGIVLGIFVARTEMRVIGLVAAIVTLPYLLSEMGLSIALVQAREVRPVHFHSIFAVNLIVGVVMALYCVAIGPIAASPLVFNAPVLKPVLALMGLIFLVLSFGVVQRAQLTRALNFGAVAIAETASCVVYCVVLTYMAWKGYGVWALAFGKLAQQIVETTALCLFARFVPDLRQVDFAEVRPMIRFGLNTAGSRIVNYLVMNADMFLVGKMLPERIGGDYAFARTMVISPSIRLAQLVTRVAMPVLARMQDDLKQMARALCRFDKLQAIIMFPVFLGLFAVAPVALHAIFGAKWDESMPLIRLLCLSVCFHALANISMVGFLSLGRADLSLRYQLRQLAVRPLALWVALIAWHSAPIVCWMILLDRVLFAWLYARKAYDLVESRWTRALGALASPTLASALMVAAVLASGRILSGIGSTPRGTVLVLAVEIAVGAAVFAAVLLLRDREVVHEIRSLLARRDKTIAVAETPTAIE